MRVGLAAIGACADPDRFDAIGHHRIGNIAEIVEKLAEPHFQIEAVPQDQIRILRRDEIARRGLVIVDFSAGLGDGFDHRRIARHVARHIRNDGEAGDHFEAAIAALSAACGKRGGKGHAQSQAQDLAPRRNGFSI